MQETPLWAFSDITIPSTKYLKLIPGKYPLIRDNYQWRHFPGIFINLSYKKYPYIPVCPTAS